MTRTKKYPPVQRKGMWLTLILLWFFPTIFIFIFGIGLGIIDNFTFFTMMIWGYAFYMLASWFDRKVKERMI